MHDLGHAAGAKSGNQRLAYREFGDRRLRLEAGIGAKGFGRSAHRSLFDRRESPERVLHTVAELAEHAGRHVGGILRDEINADTLRADEPHHLLDLVHKRLGRIAEQQVRLIEEKHELGTIEVAHLRKRLKKLRKQPQHERGVKARARHQLVGREHVHGTPAIGR